ncbi:hypothetical protein EDB83DRAFT_2522610 [Lactarius deliciosus]|nr:hypothetical protein EDB83DRAFT_2522610 [Lactarius deliciosus]
MSSPSLSPRVCTHTHTLSLSLPLVSLSLSLTLASRRPWSAVAPYLPCKRLASPSYTSRASPHLMFPLSIDIHSHRIAHLPYSFEDVKHAAPASSPSACRPFTIANDFATALTTTIAIAIALAIAHRVTDLGPLACRRLATLLLSLSPAPSPSSSVNQSNVPAPFGSPVSSLLAPSQLAYARSRVLPFQLASFCLTLHAESSPLRTHTDVAPYNVGRCSQICKAVWKMGRWDFRRRVTTSVKR